MGTLSFEVRLRARAQRRDRAQSTFAAALSMGTAAGAQCAAACSAPEPGSRVWAWRPADGCWYRARLREVRDSRAEVAWLAPPECGDDAPEEGEGYLFARGVEADAVWLDMAAVVPEAGGRPARTTAFTEDAWLQQFDVAEALGHSFCELRELCKELEAPLPRVPAGGSAEALLSDTAKSLSVLRRQGEERSTSLARAATALHSTGRSCKQQLSTSTQDVQGELAGLHAEQEALREQMRRLDAEREELRARLWALDEEHATAAGAAEKAARREKEIRERAALEAGELEWELCTEEDAARQVADQRRFLFEAAAASHDVEALLASRAQEALALSKLEVELCGRRLGVAGALSASERLRRLQLEELVLGLRLAANGAEAAGREIGSEKLAEVRGFHVRLDELLEEVWRQAVRLAAETLSEGEGGDERADSVSASEASRAAQRYKEMQAEVHTGLDRLAALEVCAAIQDYAPPPRPRAAVQTTEAKGKIDRGGGAGSLPSPTQGPSRTEQTAKGEAGAASYKERRRLRLLHCRRSSICLTLGSRHRIRISALRGAGRPRSKRRRTRSRTRWEARHKSVAGEGHHDDQFRHPDPLRSSCRDSPVYLQKSVAGAGQASAVAASDSPNLFRLFELSVCPNGKIPFLL